MNARDPLEITLNDLKIMDQLHTEREQARPVRRPLLIAMADTETLVRAGVLRDEASGTEREI